MPTPRRCSGCGAALGDPTDDDLTIVCRFCGLRHDINDLGGDAGTSQFADAIVERLAAEAAPDAADTTAGPSAAVAPATSS